MGFNSIELAQLPLDDVGAKGRDSYAKDEKLAKATTLAKEIRIYPLKQADDPPGSNSIDVYGAAVEMTPKLDGRLKNNRSAGFYLDVAETPNREWLDGSKNYKLVMSVDVPVNDFWAITAFDLETASYLRDIELME